MRIQILSDLHFEFHKDGGKAFVNGYLKPKGVDVLVIAGDIDVAGHHYDAFSTITKAYPDARILFVPGNHDFYGSSIRQGVRDIHFAARKFPNLTVLYNKMVIINGIQFLGTTLWFRRSPGYEIYRYEMNDFRAISDVDPGAFKENKKALRFLRWHLNRKSFCITHHVPTPNSTPPQYKLSNINMFFVTDLTKLILAREPRLWIHGHTHNSFNYTLGNATHVVCNPLGYLGSEINPEFLPNMMIDT